VKARYEGLRAIGLHNVYEDQRDPLQQVIGHGVVVAKLLAFQTTVPRGAFTFTSWTRGVSTLLPRADWVGFVDSDGKQLGMAPWARVTDVLGRHLKRDSRTLARWSTGDFPTAAELTKLRLSPFPPVGG
jgi:hypothetical protein